MVNHCERRLIACVLLAVTAVVAAASYDRERLEIAKQILEEVPLTDGHNDLPWNIRKFLRNQINEFELDTDLTRVEPWSISKYSHTDLPRLREGMVGAQFWSAFVPCATQNKDAVQLTLEQIDVIRRLIDKYPHHLQFATSVTDDSELYEDFYDELDNWIRIEQSMNIIFFGPADSFMRMDPETILHVITHTKKHLIPVSRVQLAWDLITDGKTSAYLQGREFLAFGTLLNVVPEEDLYYVNFGDPSVLNYFSKHYVELRHRKFGILVSAYRRYYGNDWYRNGTHINQLGWLFCAFPADDMRKITPEVFRELNNDVLNKLHRCSTDQTETLYKIATDVEAYGKPYKWSSHEVNRLSMLFTYIPEDEISSIQLEAMASIPPPIMKIMNQKKLEYFTKQQILRMSAQTRRIFILRMQLRTSHDMSQLKRGAWMNRISALLFLGNLVTFWVIQ